MFVLIRNQKSLCLFKRNKYFLNSVCIRGYFVAVINEQNPVFCKKDIVGKMKAIIFKHKSCCINICVGFYVEFFSEFFFRKKSKFLNIRKQIFVCQLFSCF